MAWYWIVTIVVGTLLAAAWTATVFNKYAGYDDDESLLLCLILPITFPVSIVIFLYHKFKQII